MGLILIATSLMLAVSFGLVLARVLPGGPSNLAVLTVVKGKGIELHAQHDLLDCGEFEAVVGVDSKGTEGLVANLSASEIGLLEEPKDYEHLQDDGGGRALLVRLADGSRFVLKFYVGDQDRLVLRGENLVIGGLDLPIWGILSSARVLSFDGGDSLVTAIQGFSGSLKVAGTVNPVFRLIAVSDSQAEWLLGQPISEVRRLGAGKQLGLLDGEYTWLLPGGEEFQWSGDVDAHGLACGSWTGSYLPLQVNSISIRCGLESGRAHGLLTQYMSNGDASSRSAYRRGLQQGSEVTYFGNGEVRKVRSYVDGIRNGISLSFDESRTLRSRGFYLDGHMVGIYQEWHSNGVLGLEGNFFEPISMFQHIDRPDVASVWGMRHGKWSEWDEAGSPVREREFNMGHLQE